MEPITQVGCDLGKRQDPTAFVVCELAKDETGAWRYSVRHVERMPLDTPYPRVVERLEAVDQALWRRGAGPRWWVDATGLGEPVIDELRKTALKGRIVPVYLTGSDKWALRHGELRLGKAPMTSRLETLLESGRLMLPDPDISEAAAALRGELQRFGRETSTGGVKLEASSGHDDLVIALALACWSEPRELEETPTETPSWDDKSRYADPGRVLRDGPLRGRL